MRRSEAEKCAKKGGRFVAKDCKCIEPQTDKPTTCLESSESSEEQATTVPDGATTSSECSRSFSSCDHFCSSSFPVSLSEPCKCTCSPDCKRRKFILDVLLKAFYKDVYDRDCCQQGCQDCPNAKFAECDEAKAEKSGAFDVLVKLFKPQGGAVKAGDVEVHGKHLDEAKKAKFAQAFQHAVQKLEAVLNA
jgi:hypothetical protein